MGTAPLATGSADQPYFFPPHFWWRPNCRGKSAYRVTNKARHNRYSRYDMDDSESSLDGLTDAPESDARSSRDHRLPSRVVIGGLIVAALALVTIVLLLQLFVAERIPELTEATLDAAEKLWEQKGPASYDMEIELRGARPGQVHIEVRDKKVTATTRDNRVPPEHTWDTWSVPGQFETLERELVLGEDPEHEMGAAAGTYFRQRCEFDSQVGFPRVYHRQVSGGGPEVYWRVMKFDPK